MASNVRNASARARAEPPPPPATGVRRWTLPIVLAVVVAVVGLVALTLVPINQSTADSFSISTPGGTTLPVNVSKTFAHDGTFSFSWTSSAPTQTATVKVIGRHGAILYSGTGSSGSGNVPVTAGVSYTFSVVDQFTTTVQVSGTLNFRAPVL